jgi:hypothetical protein
MMESLLGIVIAAGVATWVYSDARARQAAHAWLWGVGTFLLLIVVLPAWLLLRPPRPQGGGEGPQRCPWCGVENPASARACQNCGRESGGQGPAA